MACTCGYVNRTIDKATITEELENKNNSVEIVENPDIETLPLIEVECPKCKHEKAYYWTLQTRAGDEAETKFHKCAKCKHIWRDYG